MTSQFSAVSTLVQDSSGTSLTVSPTATYTAGLGGQFYIVQVLSVSNTVWVTSISGGNCSWQQIGTTFTGTTNADTVTSFIGFATATGSATATLNFNGTVPTFRSLGQLFSINSGYTPVLDQQVNADHAASTAYPVITPSQADELYVCAMLESGTQTNGSTSGYVYQTDTHSNPIIYNLDCTGSQQAPTNGSSVLQFGQGLMIQAQPAAAAPAAPVMPSFTWRERFGRPNAREKLTIPLAPPTTFGSSDSGLGTDGGEAVTATVSDSDAASGADGGEAVGILLPTVTARVSKTWLEQFRPYRKWLTAPLWTPFYYADTDYGAGTDSGPAIALSDSDSGSGADTTGTIGLSDSDTGHGTDAGESIAATLADSDAEGPAAENSAVGIMLPTVTALVSRTWLEQFRPYRKWLTTPVSPPFYYADTDYGTGLDQGSTVGLSDSDASSGNDVSGTIGLSSADSGSGLDNTETVTVADSDAGSGADGGEAIVVQQAGVSPPNAAALPSKTWQQQFRPYRHWLTQPLWTPFYYSDADAGTGTDGGLVGVSDSDGSTGSDVSGTIGLSSSDSSSGADTTGTIGLSSSDGSTGSDTTGTIGLSSSDSGTGADAGESVAAALADTDAGSGAETNAVGIQLPTVTAQLSKTWLERFRASRRWLTTPAFTPLTVVSVAVTDADASLGEDAEIDNPFPVSADTADHSSSADGGEQVTALVSSAAFTADAALGSDSGAVYQDGEAGTGTDAGYLSSATFSQSDTVHGFDQEAGALQEVSADASGTGADGGEAVTVLGADACAGAEQPEVTLQGTATWPAVTPSRTWQRVFRRHATIPPTAQFAVSDTDASSAADGAETSAAAFADGDKGTGADGGYASSAVFTQADSSLAFDAESNVFGPNASVSDADSGTGADAHLVDVYAFQPLFRFTGGQFELRAPEPPARPAELLRASASAHPALTVTVEIVREG